MLARCHSKKRRSFSTPKKGAGSVGTSPVSNSVGINLAEQVKATYPAIASLVFPPCSGIDERIRTHKARPEGLRSLMTDLFQACITSLDLRLSHNSYSHAYDLAQRSMEVLSAVLLDQDELYLSLEFDALLKALIERAEGAHESAMVEWKAWGKHLSLEAWNLRPDSPEFGLEK